MPQELIHRPPGLDPLGPFVHAWSNILEHPTGKERDFEARYEHLRSRSLDGRDGFGGGGERNGGFGFEGRGEPHSYSRRGRRPPQGYDYAFEYEPRVFSSEGYGYGYPVGGNVPNEMGAGTAFCPVCEAFARYSGRRYRGHSSHEHQIALEEGSGPSRDSGGLQRSRDADELDAIPRRMQVNTFIFIFSMCAL